jgi:Uma2 family endonuclease
VIAVASVIPPRYNPGMTLGRKKATYADVLAAPEHKVAEVINGELFLSPRPAPAHALASSQLGNLLGPPFFNGQGGPGGWIILDEPELHLIDDILVPDLAAWRIERMPRLPTDAFFKTVPDWVCEVLSPSTRRLDRLRKLPLYGKHGVGHIWMINPDERSLETYSLYREHWQLGDIASDNERVRVAPFDAIELPLGLLWETVQPASTEPAPAP